MSTFPKDQINADIPPDANLQHMLYLFEGYRARVLNSESRCPYSPGSAREWSWCLGWMHASEDLVLTGNVT